MRCCSPLLRRRQWLADIGRYSDLDTVCGDCYRAAIVAFEAGRRETMDYLRSGKCASLLEAVEYAVDDPDLRVAPSVERVPSSRKT
jgi:hypothetical protein